MKQLTCLSLWIGLTATLHAQQGTVTINEMMTAAKAGPTAAMNDLVKKNGFSIAEIDAPKENTTTNSDSTIYFTWNNAEGTVNSNIMYNSKRKDGITTNACSFTTNDSTWYAMQRKILEGGEFKLSDTEMKSTDAMDAQVYNKDDFRIKIFWSYMGTPMRYYVVDVIWFGK